MSFLFLSRCVLLYREYSNVVFLLNMAFFSSSEVENISYFMNGEATNEIYFITSRVK